MLATGGICTILHIEPRESAAIPTVRAMRSRSRFSAPRSSLPPNAPASVALHGAVPSTGIRETTAPRRNMPREPLALRPAPFATTSIQLVLRGFRQLPSFCTLHFDFASVNSRPLDYPGKPFPLCSPCPSVRNITRPSSRSSLRSSPCPSACNITRPSPRNSTRSSPCPGTCNSARPSSRNSRRSGPCPSTRHSARSFPRNSGRSTPRYIIRNSSRSCSCNSTLAGRGSKNPPARQEALIASPRLRVSSPSEP